MAWLYEHPKSGRWYLGWRVGKKVFNRSTGTIDRKEAEKQLATVEIMVDTSRQGKLTEAVYRSLTGQSVERVALKAASDEYLRRIASRIAPGSLKAYSSALNNFLVAVHASETSPALADITKSVIEKHLGNIRANASAGRTNSVLKYLRSFFRDAEEKHKTGDPTKSIDYYIETSDEADAPDRRPFTKDELQSIFRIAPKGFWKFAIMCSYQTGFRLGRIATLQWHHVNFETATFDVKDSKSRKKKKLSPPILEPLLSALKAVRAAAGNVKPTDYLWPDYAASYRATGAVNLSKEFNERVLVPAGLAKPYERNGDRRQFNEVTFHSIRHNAVTGMKEIGMPEMEVRALIGHTSQAVSSVYTHASPAQARAHLKKITSPFNEPKRRKSK